MFSCTSPRLVVDEYKSADKPEDSQALHGVAKKCEVAREDSIPNLHPTIAKDLKKRGFCILAPIGKGSQGTVYKLMDSAGKPWVLKVMKDAELHNPGRGSHLVSGIKHPGINAPERLYYETRQGVLSWNGKSLFSRPGKKDCCQAILLPYIEGDVLDSQEQMDVLQKHPEQIFSLLKTLSLAIKKLSKANINHGDLNTANVMVTSNLDPVLIDFDLSTKGNVRDNCIALGRIAKRLIHNIPRNQGFGANDGVNSHFRQDRLAELEKGFKFSKWPMEKEALLKALDEVAAFADQCQSNADQLIDWNTLQPDNVAAAAAAI